MNLNDILLDTFIIEIRVHSNDVSFCFGSFGYVLEFRSSCIYSSIDAFVTVRYNFLSLKSRYPKIFKYQGVDTVKILYIHCGI